MDGQTSTFTNLMQNKLLLQYLSGAGGAMSAGQPVGPALNQITQQNISSQNFMKLLSQMIGGKLVPGSSLKMSDKGDLAINLPRSVLDDPSVYGAGTQFGKVTGGEQMFPAPSRTDEMSFLNPSASPAIGGADLAGLTPEDISKALQFRFIGEELEQKKVSDYVDMLYKGALIRESEARVGAATPSLTIPGTDIKLTTDQMLKWYAEANKDERTAAVKNYEYAQLQGFTGSFEQFQDSATTTHQKDFAQAKKEGYEGSFNQWMLDMAKAGAINIGEMVERKRAVEDVESQKYFTSPKGLAADVDKYVGSEEVQNQLFAFAADPRKREIETVRAKEKYIKGKITASGGTITDEKLDGRTFVFTVKWQDGTTSEVRYAN